MFGIKIKIKFLNSKEYVFIQFYIAYKRDYKHYGLHYKNMFIMIIILNIIHSSPPGLEVS